MARGWVALSLTAVFLSLGFSTQVQADENRIPWGGDSDAGIAPQSPPDSSDNKLKKMQAQAASFNPQPGWDQQEDIAPVILQTKDGSGIGVVNPSNGKGSFMENGAFVKAIFRPDEGPTGGSIITDDTNQSKIGKWEKDPSGNYVKL